MNTVSPQPASHRTKPNTTTRIALCQINPTVGDFDGNLKKIHAMLDAARTHDPTIVVFPECAVCGYPPEDLVHKQGFLRKSKEAIETLARATRDEVVIVGCIRSDEKGTIYNAAAVLHKGNVCAMYDKHALPNYGVFDEQRYFVPGTQGLVCDINGTRIGVAICEDVWVENILWDAYAASNVDCIIAISASPYHAGKWNTRREIVQRYIQRVHTSVCYCNIVGGQDELVFDGASFAMSATGEVIARGKQFEEDVVIVDVPCIHHEKKTNDCRNMIHHVLVHSHAPSLSSENTAANIVTPLYEPVEEVYRALVLGTRDYVQKNGFRTVVIGLSGGIDSALVACIACDALGKEHVVGVTMPSRYSSEGTKNDAVQLAQNLGIPVHTIPIENIFTAYAAALAPLFSDTRVDLTEENIQARIRGTLLMALSNKFNWLVLTTGNKSEIAVGYCTLYGDMAGGFAVIKDVPKLLVYKLAAFRNTLGTMPVIPETTITRAPSAELRDNQKDEDSLPAYPVLDAILEQYVEHDMPVESITHGAKNIVHDVVRLVDLSEYKRRQAAPGIKITPKAFGKDRRLPITNKYRESRTIMEKKEMIDDKIIGFDTYAKEYTQKWGDVSNSAKELILVASMLPNNANIIDLACGPGNVSGYIKSLRSDVHITGIDISPNMIDIAKTKLPKEKFCVADIKKYSLEKDFYDCVICAFGLPFLTETEIEKLLQNIFNSLKKDGIAYLSAMKGDLEGFEKTSFSADTQICFVYHKREFLDAAIRKNAFTIVEYTEKKLYDTNETDMVYILKK